MHPVAIYYFRDAQMYNMYSDYLTGSVACVTRSELRGYCDL